MEQKIKLDQIEEAIADFRDGKMVIVVDDEDRENEGDIIVAAEPKLLRTIGSDFHWDAHMGSEMEVVTLASSSVGV